jgi:hypothetical protein
MTAATAKAPTKAPAKAPTKARAPRRHNLAARLTPRQREFLDAIAAELALRDPDGHALDRVDDPALLARQAADQAVDSAQAWVEHLGPMYDVEGVRRLLGRPAHPVSRQAVSKRRGLLALTTGSGRVVYPAFQFAGGSPMPHLARVLTELPESAVSRWTVASWLVSAEPTLDDQRPIDVLAAGEADAVVRAARAWAAALAQ